MYPTTTEPGDGLAAFRSELRAFIAPRFPGIQLDDRQDIFGLGFVNSLFAMELVLFIEKATGCRIPNAELSLDHFRSVDAMSALAGRIRTAAPEPAR